MLPPIDVYPSHFFVAFVGLLAFASLYVWGRARQHWRLRTLPLFAAYFGTVGCASVAAAYGLCKIFFPHVPAAMLPAAHALHSLAVVGLFILARLVESHDRYDKEVLAGRPPWLGHVVRTAPYVLAAFFIPATAVLVANPFPTVDVKTDPSIWGFVYRGLVGPPSFCYYALFAALYAAASRKTAKGAWRMRYRSGAVAILMLGMMYLNLFAWPFVPLLWPGSFLAPISSHLMLFFDTAIFTVAVVFLFRAIGMRLGRPVPDPEVFAAFEDYSSLSENIGDRVRHFLNVTRFKDPRWHLELTILEKAIRRSQARHCVLALARQTYALVFLVRSQGLDREELLAFPRSRARALASTPEHSPRSRLLMNDELTDALPAAIRLTDDETGLTLSSNPEWCQITALALAQAELLPKDLALSLLDPVSGEVPDWLRGVYEDARIEETRLG